MAGKHWIGTAVTIVGIGIILSSCASKSEAPEQVSREAVLDSVQTATSSSSNEKPAPAEPAVIGTASPAASDAVAKAAAAESERVDKAVKELNPASFCKYKFEGLDSYDYKKYPDWEDLGLDAKLAKELDSSPYPDIATPRLDKDECQDGLKRLDVKGRLGVAKRNGAVVIKPIYDYLDYPQSNPSKWVLCCVKGRFEDLKSDNGFRFVDKNGKDMSKTRYQNAFPFCEGRAAVLSEGKGWGFIDESGKTIVPCKYGAVRSFSDGITTVSTLRNWGFIDKNGKELLPEIFEANSNFKKGYAKVRYKGLWGILKEEQLAQAKKPLATKP